MRANKQSRNTLSISAFFAQWFFVGRFPVAPGTIGSIASYPIYLFIINSSNSFQSITSMFWLAFAITLIIGVVSIDSFQKQTKTYDCKSVVIDEVIGMLLVFALAFKPLYYLTKQLSSSFPSIKPDLICFFIGLIVFRFFDITKPSLIGYVDKKVKTSFGVILDDVMAAIFSAVTILVTYKAVNYFVIQGGIN